MRTIERLLYFLFPELLLKGGPWALVWDEQERREYLSSIRVFFVVAIIGYIFHYYVVDHAEGLAPSDLWFNYRFGMAGVALLGLGLSYLEVLNRSALYKLPMIAASAIFCYFQTLTILWYPKVPYLYSFAFIFICSVLLRSTVVKTLAFAFFLTLVIWPPLMEAGQSPSMMISAAFVTQVFLLFFKSKYLSDVRLFIANRQNLSAQQKIIELNMEFTEQIKAFLPKQISARLTNAIREERMSVVQAIDEVLRPKSLWVACLFSDIRGFTKGVHQPGYVDQALVPNLKATTKAVENFNGIPRKIGDLLFAYFDHPRAEQNVLQCLRAAFEISNINRELNQGLAPELRIRRYILLSAGPATVGNLSGYESGIEISALGKPVNLLARIDEVTKQVALREHLDEGDILVTRELVEAARRLIPELEFNLVSLDSLGLAVRDFPEVQEIYVFPLSRKNNAFLFHDFDRFSTLGVSA